MVMTSRPGAERQGRPAAPARVAPPADGDAEEDADHRAASLTSWLWRREQVARCSAALAVYLGVTHEEAEALLLSEARRRGVSVGLVAHLASRRTSSARDWTVERCARCGGPLRVAVLDLYGLTRVLTCDQHRGQVLPAAAPQD